MRSFFVDFCAMVKILYVVRSVVRTHAHARFAQHLKCPVSLYLSRAYLSLRAYRYASVATRLSLCAYCYVPIAKHLSLRDNHYVTIAKRLSLHTYCYTPIATCLSPRPYHYVPIARCLPLSAYRYAPLSLRP